MQDIPRNELLDKLAAGWKVRRKHWGKSVVISQNGGTASWNINDLLQDNWEGEPPEPVCTANGCSIVHAFERLREGAAFIQRGFGVNKIKINCCHTNVTLKTYDITANDWEVWS